MIQAHFIFLLDSRFFPGYSITVQPEAQITYEWEPLRKQAIVLSIALNPEMFELVGNRGALVEEIRQAAQAAGTERFKPEGKVITRDREYENYLQRS